MKKTLMLTTVGIALAVCSGVGAAQVAPKAMEVLPLGAVRPEKWLLKQLERQRDGITGHAEQLYGDIGNSDWLTGANKGGQYNWERGPYYAKGLMALAFTLDDAKLKERARRWADTVLKSQRENGDFGPKKDNWWANMIALHYLRDWCEATGDARVVPFFQKYFAYQAKRLPAHSLQKDSAWACCRGGDELEVVMWLYDRTQDAAVLDFARLLASQTADWTNFYHDGGDGSWNLGYRSHIVNFMQGLKFPAVRSRLSGDVRDRSAYRAAFDPEGWAMRMHGRIDRMVNGTEPLSGRGANQGTELCAIAERILSCREVLSATGEMQAADDMEVVAFNSLPATLGDDGRGLRYYLLLNQPMCTMKSVLGFECNGRGDAYTPGPDAGFGCCRSNFHFAWPKFVQSLWMAKDGGLAAVAYAPSKVTTPTATIRTSGAYPFGDGVTLEVLAAKGGKWPLFVRIPGWCCGADVKVNGVSVNGAVAGRFCRLEREWKAGDKVELAFPAEAQVETGINGSVAVKRGALVYSLKMAADITVLPVRKGREGFPAREYRAKDAWNRALVLKDAHTLAAEFKPAAEAPADPFVHGAVPCSLKVKAGFTTYGGWGSFRPLCFTAQAVEPPPSPLAKDRVTDVGDIELVPLGSTQIRITLFPWTQAR